jgi:hypothetical protein
VATVSLEVLPAQPTTTTGGTTTDTGSSSTGGTTTVTTPAAGAVVTRLELFVGMLVDKLSVKKRTAFSVPYLSTLAGDATLKIRKGAKTLATSKGKAKKGKNKLGISRKAAAKLAAGRYKAVLSVVSTDGQTATDSLRLTIR